MTDSEGTDRSAGSPTMSCSLANRPEDKYVKIPALVHATRVGYTYLSERSQTSGTHYDPDTNIFFESLRTALERINSTSVTEEQAREIAAKLRSSLDGDNLGRPFFDALQSGLDGMRLLDFTNPENNTFQVLTELPYVSGENSFRPDITFLVNGLPLGFMEVKRQNNANGIRAERERMFARFKNPVYRRFANVTQLMAFSNNQEYDDDDRHHLHGSFYASSAYGKMKFNHFREEHAEEMTALVAPRNPQVEQEICLDTNLPQYYGSVEFESSVESTTPANRIITSLFSPERFLFLLRYGIAYVERTDEKTGVKQLEKHVMRYPQLFATQAVRKALDEGRQKGVIWHTQGSGKTALSFFLTRYLRDYFQGRQEIARFFFIVDRLDLATQAAREFRWRGAQVNVVSSREQFAKALAAADDVTSQVRSFNTPVITVVNIQKFSEGSVATDFDYDVNVRRVYFIDEAHRDYKHGGAFLKNLVTSDREAVKFALTGTPLVDDRKGNATKQVFGDYIHTYFYNRSIADGYTLKLLREDVRTEFRVKMQEVLKDLQEVKRLVRLEDVFKHKAYVEPLVDYIVDDYLRTLAEHDDDSLGAMIVAHSSAQARAIYAHLQDLDPDISSELILHDEGTKESRKEVCDSFAKDESPINILVVYNMLLTGFDAHRLKKLYLCRPIKAHNLLQALTRVNRPYKDMAFGYVVDFADITEEYDKTNRAYLAELNDELGDAAKEYSSLFESPESIEADLKHIKDVLWEFTTDNVVEFQNEIARITDKTKLYELRNALSRYKDLRNVAHTFGFEELYERFDVSRAVELLTEVSLRINALNAKEALALEDMSTGDMNLLLANMEFSFRNIGKEELSLADDFQDKLRRAYSEAGHNIDQKDPEFVALLEELKKKFRERDMEELDSAQMVQLAKELEGMRVRFAELNRQNEQLAKKYGGDAKFVRAHKRVLRNPPPFTESQAVLCGVLGEVKRQMDGALMNNRGLLSNHAFFQKEARRFLKRACAAQGAQCTAQQVIDVADFIAAEYSSEGGRLA